MAKNINHLQHVKSSVVEEGLPKLPQPSVLVEGEIAVNYAADYETLSIKNSSGEVVTFSSDNYYSEKKLGSGFTGENSGVTVTQAMNNTEKVVAAALNDLNSRKLDASAYTPTDLSDYATKQWVDEERLGSGFTGENSGKTVTQVIEDDELAISAALNDLDDRKLDMSAYTPTDLSNYYDKDEIDGFLDGFDSELLKYADKAEYNSSDKKIYFKNGDTTLSSMTIDATDFIKDGMVNEVKIDTPASGESSGVTCLIVTFNTDAGKEDIEIPLSEIFDSSLYYTKPEIDNVLGSGFTVSAVTSSVTDVFRENELIVASALNDLDGRKLDASAYTPTDLSDYYTKQEVNTMLGDDFIDFSGESFSSVTDIIRADETVMAAALNDLNERKLDASAYTPSEFTDLLDEKLGYWFSGDSLSSVTDVIRENEIVVSSALNDLESRKLDASAYTPTDLSGYATEEWVDERLGSGFTESSVTEVFNETEEVIAEALADLDSRISGNTTYINQVNSKADTIARSLSGYTPSGYSYSKGEVDIKLADKLDASAYTPTDLSDYATKEWIEDDVLGSGFTTGDYSGKSITEVIEENELIIASALNDLDERVIEISGDTGAGTIVSGEYSNGTLYLDKNDGTSIEVSGFTTGGGGGEENVITGITVNNVAQTPSNKVVNITVPTSLSQITSAHTHSEYALNTAFTAHTASTTVHVTSTEKSTWNGKQDALSNASVLTGITSQKVTNWDNAATSAHSHSNKTVLDNLTQTVIDNSHTHSNKTVLDGITTTKTASWDTVTAKTDNSAFTAHTANTTAHVTASERTTWNGKQDAISDLASIRTSAATQSDWNATSGVAMIKNKPTIPAAPGTLTTTATTAQSTATNEALSGNIALHKVSKTGSYNDLTNKPTIPTVSNSTVTLTFNGATVGSFTLNGTGGTIDIGTVIGLPSFSAANNGQILGVVNGQLAWVTPTTIYTGSGTPSSSQGNNGDIYLQTS